MTTPVLSKRNLRRMKRIRALEERKQRRQPVMKEWGNPKAFQAPFEALRREVASQLNQKILTASQWKIFSENMSYHWVWKAGPAEAQPGNKYNTPIQNLIPRERKKIIEGKPKQVSSLYNTPWIRMMTRVAHDPNYVQFSYHPNLVNRQVEVIVQVGKNVTPAKIKKRLIAFLIGQNMHETKASYNRESGGMKQKPHGTK